MYINSDRDRRQDGLGEIVADKRIVPVSHERGQYLHRRRGNPRIGTARFAVQTVDNPARAGIVLGHHADESGPVQRILRPRPLDRSGRSN